MAPPSSDLSDFNSDFRHLSFSDLTHHQDMDDMNIDTVPDTPDRFGREKSNRGGNFIGEVHSPITVGSSGSVHIMDKGVNNRERDNSKSMYGNQYRRLNSHHRGKADIGFNREFQQNGHAVVDLVDSPSPANAKVSMREQSEHVGYHDNRAKLDGGNSSMAELLAEEDTRLGKDKGKKSLNSRSKMLSNTLSFVDQSPRKNNLHWVNTSSTVDDTGSVRTDHVKKVPLLSYTGQNAGPSMSRSMEPTMTPRKNGQRRLVRNGCISPNNIAKVTNTVECHEKGCDTGKPDNFDTVSQFEGLPSPIQFTSPPSGGTHADKVKGKGVMEECSAQKYDNGTSNSSSRNLSSPTEEANTNENASRVDISTLIENSGWRSTRNCSNSTSLTLSVGTRHLSSRNDGLDHSHEVRDAVSLQRGSTQFPAQASSGLRSDMDRESGRHSGTSKIACRQKKRGSTFNNSGECSTSVDDPEVSLLSASGDILNARAIGTRINRRRVLHPIIEIDDTPHEPLPNTTQLANDESEVRARQLEADEMLARELQEQLYHEDPGVGVGEVDANIAWTLQHEEEAQHASSLRRQRVNSRDASMSHLYRHHQTQALQNSLTRASRGRASNSGRMTRLRERIRNSPETLSSTDHNIHFHPNMDVDMRIHILEQLEAALGGSGRAMPNRLLRLDRDFNENDYEMLLALDDNNHQHVGANSAQINGLPQSTVQSENFAEACAVCLETPTIGDTIRHLPCLHKFHKDCIDPWLRRKTSCPICKSGIT